VIAPNGAGPRVLGIVGGTGPESTVDYYRKVIATWRRRRPDGSYPRVIIDSVEGGSVIRQLGEGQFPEVGRQVGAALAELAAAGCGRAMLASNATHLAVPHIDPPSPIPLIDIVDTALAAAAAAGHRRLGVIGTRFVMESSLYPDRFGPAGIAIAIPLPEERELVHHIYIDHLVQGIIRDDDRDALVAVISAMRVRDGIDGVILGGTELALTLTDASYGGVAVLDTAQLHVDAGVDWLLGDG
jgi:aspartate racemase